VTGPSFDDFLALRARGDDGSEWAGIGEVVGCDALTQNTDAAQKEALTAAIGAQCQGVAPAASIWSSGSTPTSTGTPVPSTTGHHNDGQAEA